MSSNMCSYCGVKPKRPPHAYCSKTCGQKATQAQMCTVCHSKPRYVEGGTTHPYCSKTCAKAVGHTDKFDPTKVCLYCKKRRQSPDHRYYCSSDCHSKADGAAPTLLEIPSEHVDYKSIEQQFRSSWKNTSRTMPAIRHIYKVVVHPSVVQQYKQYRSRVEARGKFSGKKGFNGKVMSEGNEHRRWHGTRRQCKLGEPGNSSLCQAPTCSLCRIIQSNYNIQISIAKGSWERFGHGIYTSSTSAKSDSYASNAVASPLKALLLNHVVVGRGYKLTSDQTNLQQPPNGYDSVLGEISPGMLSDDELVVYDNNAICPAYLVMYAA